jgi:hypothetical protein
MNSWLDETAASHTARACMLSLARTHWKVVWFAMILR